MVVPTEIVYSLPMNNPNLISAPKAAPIIVGEWLVDLSSGQCCPVNSIQNCSDNVRLEPKVCAVLQLLVAAAGQVVSKEQLIEAVWEGRFTSDDSITRTLSRLRAALGDDAKVPRYIETVPKRGYRLVATVQHVQGAGAGSDANSEPKQRWLRVPILLVILIASVAGWFSLKHDSDATPERLLQADNFYHQMRLADNEMAMTLYQQHLAIAPQSAHAYAGLANTLVQKAMRWSNSEVGFVSLTQSLQQGALQQPEAQQKLARAADYAQRALALEPANGAALKAMGFVRSAQGQFDEAITMYQQALTIEPDAWPVLLNLGELFAAQGDSHAARQQYQQAFQVMRANYLEQEVQIRPWISDVAVLVGSIYADQGNLSEADFWYRQALFYTPLHESATLGLVAVYVGNHDPVQALQLCVNLNQKLQTNHDCDALVRVLSD
ncbi:MAG: Transcriptional activator CadC [Pseudidiomarina mangrovi]|nr:MAG: Transcriptional activator CadC [Pseudidiomarina mangrovi]